MGKDNLVANLSLDFAIRIVNLYKFLCTQKKEYVLSNQVLRSGTSIGANLAESEMSQSAPDFIAKLHIALKEANETKYWLTLLQKTNYITKEQFDSINKDLRVIIGLLVNGLKKIKDKQNDGNEEL
ncbi:MAG: four helix bundle protein [Prevotellaceae bacterium]|nr:four helix bundle protein [Prevotellaceae bacterium]